MNKRGDITIIVLVLGVVGICILTIISFVGVNTNVDNTFLGVGLIETMNSMEEELSLSELTDFNRNYENLFEKKNVKISMEGDVLKGSYFSKEKVLVWVEYNYKE